MAPRYDACTAGNVNDLDVVHVDIDWTVDFDKHTLRGSCTLTIKARKATKQLVEKLTSLTKETSLKRFSTAAS